MPTHFLLLFEPDPFGTVRTAGLCYTWFFQSDKVGMFAPILSWSKLDLWTPGHEGAPVLFGLLSTSSLFFILISFISFYPISLGLSAVLSHPDFLCFTRNFRGWGLWLEGSPETGPGCVLSVYAMLGGWKSGGEAVNLTVSVCGKTEDGNPWGDNQKLAQWSLDHFCGQNEGRFGL